MKRLLLSLFSAAALLFAGLAPAQVTTDAAKTGVPVATPIGSGTFAQMKAVTGMSNGDSYLVTNYGRGGSIWRYSSTAGDWFPAAPVLIYENTDVISGVAQTAAQVLLAIPVEANLLKGKRFRIRYSVGKSGTTDTMTPAVRMGSAGTTADAGVASPSQLAAGTRSVGYQSELFMVSTTSAVRLGGGPSVSFGASTSSTALNGATTVADVTAANYITVTCTMGGTTDTPQLGYVAVEILP